MAPNTEQRGEPVAFDVRLRFTFDYLDREITAMGWLAGIAASIVGAAISQPFLRVGGPGASDGREARLSEMMLSRPESMLMSVGCAIVLGSAVCFLTQRVKLTTKYGSACDRLLIGGDPTDVLRTITGWRAWQPYVGCRSTGDRDCSDGDWIRIH